jgi:hypothetical protein
VHLVEPNTFYFFVGLMLSYFAFQEPFVNEFFSGQSHQSLVM